MISIMFIMIAGYVLLVMISANSLIAQLEHVYEQDCAKMKAQYQKLSEGKTVIEEQKSILESESLEMFTLYEMTREITKSLNEQKAFELFKETLNEHVRYTKCLLLEPLDAEIKELEKSEDYFIFVLQGKQKKIGYLAVNGLHKDDEEKFSILAHQFALALRRVKLYQEIEKIAITDSLTGVHTRRHIIDRFQEELRRSKGRRIKMSFLMVDVDFFKKYNDTHGHLAGDQILREISNTIKDNIREIDIAGRYGGEEFCVILPDTDRVGAQYAAERIRKATEQAVIRAYDTQVTATLSIGIATFPDDGKTVDELIDKADWALYRAKKLGRNRVCSFGVYQDDEKNPT